MDREAIKNFIKWLENATDDEIIAHIEEVRKWQKKVNSKEGHADINLAFRLIDEELIARMCLHRKTEQ